MPKRSRKPRNPRRQQSRDPNVLAAEIVDEATHSESKHSKKKKNPAAVALGKLGGKKGGPARARKLSPERRVEIALKAARKRWGHEEDPS